MNLGEQSRTAQLDVNTDNAGMAGREHIYGLEKVYECGKFQT